MSIRPHLILALCLGLAAGVGLSGQTGLPAESPFARAGIAARQPAADETIEFAGVSLIGSKIDLVFYDKAVKKSRWIPLGTTVAGISAISYDPEREQAVVRINGTEKILAMRKPRPARAGMQPGQPANPSMAAMAPAPAVPSAAGSVLTVLPDATLASPPQKAGPPTPESRERIETEARMLVSDLLEIGIAQRQAYEEARRKAAENEKTGSLH